MLSIAWKIENFQRIFPEISHEKFMDNEEVSLILEHFGHLNV